VAHTCNPATQEAEIRRIMLQIQPGQIVCLISKSHHKKRADGVTQGVGLEFKPQIPQKRKKRKVNMDDVLSMQVPI
jgi:hypothetical protein